MKHKLSVLPVLFALLALVFVFTACGSDGNVQSEGVIKPRTITFYSITDEATTDEAIQRVQDELNKITESLYKVHVVLKLYPEAEYEEVLKQAIIANEDGVVFKDTEVVPDDSLITDVGETEQTDDITEKENESCSTTRKTNDALRGWRIDIANPVWVGGIFWREAWGHAGASGLYRKENSQYAHF